MSSEVKLFRLISESTDMESINDIVVPCTHSTFQSKMCFESGCVNARDKNGNTALHLAAQAECNSDEMTEILLEKGKANPGIKNSDGETPVLLAAKKGNLLALKSLISKCSERGFSYGLLNRISQDNGKKNGGRQCSANVLEKACESKNEDCVNYLIDEICTARRTSMKPTLNTQISCTNSIESLNVKEFLSVSDIKQIVFFELGNDLAKSIENHESSTYAKILFNTPTSFRHLLDGCLFTYRSAFFGSVIGHYLYPDKFGLKNKIYVDFFPFYNPGGGSEFSILKIIINFKRFELLTHPVCELFLHLNWLRARFIYCLVILLYFLFTVVTYSYTLLSYGQVGMYVDQTCDDGDSKSLKNKASEIGAAIDNNSSFAFINTTSIPNDNESGALPCIARWFCVPLIILSACVSLIEVAKLVADRGGISFFYNKIYWTQPELWSHIIVFVIACIEQLPESLMLQKEIRKVLSTISVLIVSKMMVQVIARDPDIAIFVEMVKKIQMGLSRIFISYVWLFIGWILVFHINLGENKFSSFNDLGSATSKVIAMFTGEIGFETAFKSATTYHKDFKFHFWITIIYTVFVFEMCLTLMNVLIGLAISNIQELRQKGDALRLVKEVLLGGYLESLLRAHPLRRPFRLVDPDLFNGSSVYQLDQLITDESVVPCYTLKLLRPTLSSEMEENKPESKPISVPTNIGIKLRQLLKDMDVKEKEMEKGDKSLSLEALKDIHAHFKEISTSVKDIKKILQDKLEAA